MDADGARHPALADCRLFRPVAGRASAMAWLIRRRKAEPMPLPEEWALTARPVFSSDERRVYRQLREALPHHIVLSKLPLVRFCQPTDPQQVRYWYELLGADPCGLCDLQRQRPGAGRHRHRHRTRQLAARAADQAEGAGRLPRALPALPGGPPAVGARAAVAGAPPDARFPRAAGRANGHAHRRRQRASHAGVVSARLWQDSGFFQDSFFGSDSRQGADTSSPSEFGGFLARCERARDHAGR